MIQQRERQNREQIRAAAALGFWATTKSARGKNEGNTVSKIPAMIITNGLLATLAFLKAGADGQEKLAGEICRHLRETKVTPVEGFRAGETEFDAVLRSLTSGSATHLITATAETLAYLSYLKRFQPKKNGQEQP